MATATVAELWPLNSDGPATGPGPAPTSAAADDGAALITSSCLANIRFIVCNCSRMTRSAADAKFAISPMPPTGAATGGTEAEGAELVTAA